MKDRSEESNMAEEKHTHHHHEHDHEHGHHHHHHEDGPLKPGEHPDWRTHVHAPGEHHEVGVNDYMTAIAAYRKTFASKEDVLEQTPDPAVREMIKYLGQLGCDTVFDRFDQQKPQCTFGLAGVCCKNCNMGPCKITKKSPLGVCGADADVIVARNLLRSAAAGVAQHGAHAREILLSMKFVAEGRLKLPILGEKKLRTVSKAFGLETEGKSARELTGELADILLEDLSRAVPDDYKTIRVMAPKERQDVWDKLDIIPISAYNEVFDSYHRTAVGTDGDWESLMQEFLRCGLAFCFTGVIPLSNAVGAELVLGTGALDLWCADVQDVYPAIMDVARCFKTTVVTTSENARLPGAEHYAYDHHHANVEDTEKIARKIVTRAIESFAARRDIPVHIPKYEVTAEVGFTAENVAEQFDGFKGLYEALKDGRIRGICNIVGCSNPRVVYERATLDVARTLIQNNILILTNGCASFPLLKMGLCSKEGAEEAGASLQAFLKKNDLPPVWHVGECVDNTRSSAILGGIAAVAGVAIKDMPYAFSSPEWSNEKGLDASLAFRLFGIDSYHCVEPPVQGSTKVENFLKRDTKETLGAVMHVNVDPLALGKEIVADIEAQRQKLGWD